MPFGKLYKLFSIASIYCKCNIIVSDFHFSLLARRVASKIRFWYVCICLLQISLQQNAKCSLSRW